MVITRYYRPGPKLKIAVISDLHDKKCDFLLPKLEKEKPDILLIPGDLTSRKLTDPENQNTERNLKIFASLCPVFYARGNHEWMWNGKDRKKAELLGIHFLENSFERFGNFVIGGVKTKQRSGHFIKENPVPQTRWLENFVNEPGYHILLLHQPEFIGLVPKETELVVSGHAHGGQINLFGHGLFAPGQGIFPKYFHGEYGNMIVSAGLANTVPLVPRIGNPTELVIVEIGNAAKLRKIKTSLS